MIKNFSLLRALALAALTLAPGAVLFANTVSPVFVPPRNDDKSPVGKRNRGGTVAQAKRQSLKAKRRKAHRMHCK